MTPWLVEFHLVPRPRSPQGNTVARGQPGAWNAERPLPPDFARRITALGLPADESARGATRAWGRPDGNQIEIREDGAGQTTVRVAVDMRKLDPGFAAGLLGLVKASHGLLVRSDGLVIDGTVGAFSKALRSSPAWAHVDDPTGLLTGREPTEGDDE
jgi:hypothetical protein